MTNIISIVGRADPELCVHCYQYEGDTTEAIAGDAILYSIKGSAKRVYKENKWFIFKTPNSDIERLCYVDTKNKTVTVITKE